MDLESQIVATMPQGTNVDEWSGYERAALRLLIQHGVTDLGSVGAYGADDGHTKKERFTVWIAESCVWTIREIRAGRNREAIRGILQMADYVGRLDGFWPHSGIADAFMALRNHFEDALAVRS